MIFLAKINFYIKSAAILSAFFSILLPLILSSISLLFFSKRNNLLEKYFLWTIFILYLVINISSRNFIDEIQNDLSIYYLAYTTLQTNSIIDSSFAFSGGLEIGWPIIYKIIGIFFNDLNPINIAQINSLLTITLSIWALCKINIKNKNWSPTHTLVVIFFISFVTTSYLQRQALATIFLFLSFFYLYQSRAKTFTFLFLSSIFHLSSLPIFLFLYLISKINPTSKNILLFIIVLLISRFILPEIIIQVAKYSEIPGLNKIKFYEDQESTFAIASLKFLIISIATVFYTSLKPFEQNNKWNRITIFMSLFYIIFTGVPLLSERITFLMLIFYGYLLLQLKNEKLSFNLKLFSFTVFLIYFIDKSRGDDPLWSRIPAFSLEPLYYLN